MKLFFSKKK